MKILVIARGYPTGRYPQQGIFEYDQARALAELGHDVIYVVVDVRSIRRVRKFGYKSFIRDKVNIESFSYPVGNFSHRLVNFFLQYGLKRLYKKIVKKYGEIDIIHSHFIQFGFASVRAFRNTNIPLVHTEHYSEMNKMDIDAYYRYLGDHTYHSMDKLICVSKILKQRIYQNFNVDSIIIPNIFDANIFSYEKGDNDTDEFNFISVGNLVPNKRMYELVIAFNAAFKYESAVHLHIYGDGPERKKINHIIEELDLINKVHLHGRVTRDQISVQMKKSKCFVLFSERETFGVAHIEALASGLTVISSKSGGPEDFINESNGILLDYDTEKCLVSAFEKIFNNNICYDPIKISDQIVSQYNAKIIATKLTNEYTKIVDYKSNKRRLK